MLKHYKIGTDKKPSFNKSWPTAESHECSHSIELEWLYFTIKASDLHFCFIAFNLGKTICMPIFMFIVLF